MKSVIGSEFEKSARKKHCQPVFTLTSPFPSFARKVFDSTTKITRSSLALVLTMARLLKDYTSIVMGHHNMGYPLKTPLHCLTVDL